MRSYHVEVPGLPRPWTVWAKRGPQPQGFMNMKAWQFMIREAIRNTYTSPRPVSGPVSLTMVFQFPIPKTCPKTEPKRTQWLRRHPPGRGDLRNYEKAAEDSIQGLLITNDSQVVESWGKKEWLGWQLQRDGVEGLTVIEVQEIGDG